MPPSLSRLFLPHQTTPLIKPHIRRPLPITTIAASIHARHIKHFPTPLRQTQHQHPALKRPFTMSTNAPKSQEHSKACCSIPPVIAKDYKTKGEYQTIDGLKTYVTGSPTSTTGILLIMDIFGFFPQTLQGADILSATGRVFLPDFFDGEPAPISWYPPTTDEMRAQLGAWFGSKANPVAGAAKARAYLAAFKAQNPHITTWLAVGYCWGGKVVALTSGADTPWAASAQVHPAMLAPEDAAQIAIPHVLLASMDEDAKDVRAFDEALKLPEGRKHVETFGSQIHGWMAARGDLEDPAVVKEYERGYKILLDFFGRNL